MPALLNLQHMTKVTKLINPNFVNTNLNQSWAYECQTCVKWPPYGAKMLIWGVILDFLGTPKGDFGCQMHTFGTGLETKEPPKMCSQFRHTDFRMFWGSDGEPNGTKNELKRLRDEILVG